VSAFGPPVGPLRVDSTPCGEPDRGLSAIGWSAAVNARLKAGLTNVASGDLGLPVVFTTFAGIVFLAASRVLELTMSGAVNSMTGRRTLNLANSVRRPHWLSLAFQGFRGGVRCS